jgi:BioD-like phosphotransacetylase family protein
MKPLLITSNQQFSGKSSICIGLGKTLSEKGYKVGFMKTLITLPEKAGDNYIDEDVRYITKILDLEDDLKDLSPLIFSDGAYFEALDSRLKGEEQNYIDTIVDSYNRISKGKDLMIVECSKKVEYGLFAGISSKKICDTIKGVTVIVMKYYDDIVDYVLSYKELFQSCFGGIIINFVPKEAINKVNEVMIPFFKQNDINVFGAIPTDKVLSSVSIKEMALHLNGKVLCAADKTDELVESFMVGAMGHELAMRFFRTKTDKVVITGGDRADIQLAALETNTKCIILTGNFQPSTVVTGRAEELGVPMILVKDDTLTTVSKLNEIMGRSGLHEPKKLDKIMQITSKFIDSEKLLSILNT